MHFEFKHNPSAALKFDNLRACVNADADINGHRDSLVKRIAKCMVCETEHNNGGGTARTTQKRKSSEQSALSLLLFFLCNLCIIDGMQHDAARILLSLIVLDAL